ncbi:type II toxin-antitoxin system HicB family antitoxin [candidate division WOR-3 bacterium]|nr:type II toxin-antitoxin system HicB family antitoxin [candidate division WOR-3 bacterium]
MKSYKFTSVIWKEEIGYVSKCPELGVASAGNTVEEALKNLKEAVELYLENAEELGMLDEIEAEFKFEEKFTSPLEVSVR